MQRLIGPKELGELCGVPVQTIYSWMKRRRGPKAIRIGRHLRFRPEDVAEWLTEHELGGDAA